MNRWGSDTDLSETKPTGSSTGRLSPSSTCACCSCLQVHPLPWPLFFLIAVKCGTGQARRLSLPNSLRAGQPPADGGADDGGRKINWRETFSETSQTPSACWCIILTFTPSVSALLGPALKPVMWFHFSQRFHPSAVYSQPLHLNTSQVSLYGSEIFRKTGTFNKNK